MPRTLEQKVVDLAAHTQAVIEKAAAAQAADAARQARVAELVPRVVDAMITHERIEPGEGTKLASLLADHARALEVLLKTAAHRAGAERDRLGSPAPAAGAIKAAAALGPYVGARTAVPQPSDLQFLAAFGLGG